MKKGLHKSKKMCYDNPRWEISEKYGPVAQLGERTVRIRKVVGSNPFRSTKMNDPTQFEQVNETCEFGGVVVYSESLDITAFF